MTYDPTVAARPHARAAGWWIACGGAIGAAAAYLCDVGLSGIAPAVTCVVVGIVIGGRHPRRPGEPATLSPPLDRALALHRCDGDALLLDKLLAGIAQEGAEQLAAIKDGLERRDAPRVRLAAHRLKGSLQCVAAGPAEAAALDVEVAARDGDLARATTGCDRLRNELARLSCELPAIR
jgi:HPt (histidine-containing phosphotransfer) domain-containing protein